MFPTILFIYFLVCGVTGLILWFNMLRIMESKGQKVNYFFTTPGQLIKFYRVIKEENNTKKKLRYRIIFWTQISLIPLYLIGMIILIRLIEL